MRKQLLQIATFLSLALLLCLAPKMTAEAFTKGSLGSDGYLYNESGKKVVNDFVFDGAYTYYAQADSTPMMDRLTYHPDGEHIIYFDEDGHEVFNAFQYCPSVGYTCYFDSNGYIYKDKITFYEGGVYYLNANGAMENNGWFQFANGVDYGYAYEDGSLNTYGFDFDPWGRVVYYHWNGMVARGLIQDGNFYYSMDTTDGHYLGKFSTGNTNPLYGEGFYIVGVNIPAGEYFLAQQNGYAEIVIVENYGQESEKVVRSDYSTQDVIFTVTDGQVLIIIDGIATPNLYSQWVDTSQTAFYAKVGVHIQPGYYLITSTGSEDGSYYNAWNDSTFKNGVASTERFYEVGEYEYVRLYPGQVLEVWNAQVTYICP